MSYSSSIEQEIAGHRTGYAPPPQQDRRWRPQEGGQQIDRLIMPITVTRCVYLASATRDFSPLHHSRDYAQKSARQPDMFVNTPFLMGMANRYATDWAGPRARIRSLRIQLRGAICAGADMTLDGRVERWFEEDGEGRVEIKINFSTEAGPVTEAVVVLALPREHEGEEA